MNEISSDYKHSEPPIPPSNSNCSFSDTVDTCRYHSQESKAKGSDSDDFNLFETDSDLDTRIDSSGDDTDSEISALNNSDRFSDTPKDQPSGT